MAECLFQMLASLEDLVPMFVHVILFRQFNVKAAGFLALRLVRDGLLGWDEVRLLDVCLPALVEVSLIVCHLCIL